MIARRSGARRPLAALAAATALALPAVSACSGSGGGKPASSPSPATSSGPATNSPTPLALPVSHPTVWLCRPGMSANPCEGNLDATVHSPDGSTSLEKFVPAADPKIDCFYIYPTVSGSPTINAPLAAQPEEIATARAQVARFASVCRLFVPVYRQVTVAGLTKNGLGGAAGALADADVDSAWHDYLDHDNNGRGVLLLGHSQGGGQALRLLRDEIEKNPVERGRLVAAYVIGANVLVPPGKDVGGDLQQIPACRSRSQHGCIVAYSSFDHQPPATALFGRTATAFASTIPPDRRGSLQVLCVNPAALTGGTAKLHPYFPSGGRSASPAAGPGFNAYPGQISGRCTTANGATYLQIDHPASGPAAPPISDALGPSWGLHLLDMQLDQGDLISLAAAEAAAWPS